MHTLTGKVAVVTGASSGMGRAIAHAFASAGAKVALLARNAEALKSAADEVAARGGEALIVPIDVSDAAAVDAAADQAVARWGSLDVWVNNAMVSVFAPVHRTTAAEYRRVIEVNYLGYVHGTLAALRHMRPAGTGLIIQIGSALAYRSIPLQSAYCASKAAVRGFTDSLRSELIREKSAIEITMLQLPAVNTPQFEVVRNRLQKHPQPVPPVYQPEAVAKAVVRAALHPQREGWIGWSTVKAIIGQRLAPGLLDRYVARNAWESQQTDELPPGHAPRHDQDNLDAPLPGDQGVHGPFDDRTHSLKLQSWLRTHRRLAFAAAAAATVSVVARLRRR